MFQHQPIVHWARSAIGAACLTLLIAWLAVPAPAQSEQAGAANANSAAAETKKKADEDDDLLEPSDTGYIDDAVVGSKLRLRYDSATDATKPDRAEFIYGKCTCFRTLFGQDAASPGPAESLDFEELELTWEHAFSDRFSLFVEVPFRSIDLTIPAALVGPLELGPNVGTSGLGDIRAGMKYALIAERDRWVTLQLRGYFASGDAEKALGTNHATIEPGVLYLGKPSDRWSLAGELRWWHPLSGSSDPVSEASGRVAGFESIRAEAGGKLSPLSPDPRVRNSGYAGDVIRFGVGASYKGRGKRVRVSPVVELVGWYVVDGYVFAPGEPIEADNASILNLKLGARIGGRGPGSVYLGYGHALSHEDWYDGVLRFEYRLPLAARKRHRTAMAAPEMATGKRPPRMPDPPPRRRPASRAVLSPPRAR